MRVSLIHNRYTVRGGEGSTVDRQAEWLAESGHVVTRLDVDNRRVRGWKQKLVAGLSAPWSPAGYAYARAALHASSPDVGHVHNWFPLLSPAVYDALGDLGIPIVQTLHNYRLGCAAGTFLRGRELCTRCEGGDTRSALRGRCYRGSLTQTWNWARTVESAWRGPLGRVDAFVAPSRVVAERHTAMGLPGDRIHVIPHGVPDPGPDAVSRAHASGGGIYVGRLSWEKGIDVLIEAWRGVDHPLRIVGEGPEGASLRRLARDMPNVEFLGVLGPKAVQRRVAEAGLVIMPHRWLEPFGLVAIEAFALGRPVVCSALGGPRELVTGDVNGLHVPPEDPKALRGAIQSLLRAPTRLEALGQCARRTYLREFTPERHCDRLLDLYRSLTARRRLPLSA